MKNLPFVFIISSFLVFSSCQTENDKLGDFKVLPHPQELVISGISELDYDNVRLYYSPNNTPIPITDKHLEGLQLATNQSKAQVIYMIDEDLDISPEGYTLEIQGDQIAITGKDKAGLFYGFKTLEQLIIDAKEQDVRLPECAIKDFPLLSYRAIHLDVKHHLEKTDYYYDLIDKLSGYKVNAIIVEMEDKLKFERQPLVASADALTIEEWKVLSVYANDRNISISPLIQGLGHASFVLKHDKYKHLRDDPNSDWAFNPLDPETYEVQFDLYLDAIEATPHGKYLHVGGDEVHTTGRNSGRPAIELQLNWLNKVSVFAAEHDRIPIFWDDMPLKHAGVIGSVYDTKMTAAEVDELWAKNEHKLVEFLDLFPKNCIYMRWNYHSPNTPGNSKAMQWFRDNGLQVMGATAGQTRWTLMPQREGNIQNIKDFAVSSIESNSNGLLLTLWDDDSPHFELYKRGIVAFAEYTWAGDQRTKAAIKIAYRQREFSHVLAGDEFAFIDDLEGPVAFWRDVLMKDGVRNQLVKKKEQGILNIIDLPEKINKGAWSEKYADKLEKVALHLKTTEAIASKIAFMKANSDRNDYTLEVYEQVNELVRFSLNAMLTLKEFDESSDLNIENIASEKVKSLSEEFRIIRTKLESVYGKSRILNKPDNYILDQDHHNHPGNQTINFDWQFIGELLFLEKIEKEF
jgi:hexosaminidase